MIDASTSKGTSGKENFLTDDQLHDYIVNKDFGPQLNDDQAQSLAQAFIALASRDPEFRSRPATITPRPAPSTTERTPEPSAVTNSILDARSQPAGRLPVRAGVIESPH